MADQGGPQLASLPRRHGVLEEHPHVGALARAGDFQRCGHRQLPTRAHKGPGVITPVLLVEVHGQKVAEVVPQQGVEANGVLAGQMAIDRFIA